MQLPNCSQGSSPQDFNKALGSSHGRVFIRHFNNKINNVPDE